MILPDLNLILYAYNRGSEFHLPARKWWETTLRGCLKSHETASLRVIKRIMAMRIIASLVSMRTS
jgi:predicted nucleic acid-binding protein